MRLLTLSRLSTLAGGLTCSFAVVPALLLVWHSPLPGLLSLGFTLAVLLALGAIPDAPGWSRWLRRSIYLVLNVSAASVAMAIWLTGALPTPMAIASLHQANLQEVSTFCLANPGFTLALLAGFSVVLGRLFFRKALPTLDLRRNRYQMLLLMPLGLPVVAPALVSTYPLSQLDMARAAYYYGDAVRQVNLSKLPTLTSQSTENQLIVLVLGESSSASYWQLNGYKRATTPRMLARQASGELINFPRHVSTAQLTSGAVAGIFNLTGVVDNLKSGDLAPSLVSLMREANWSTAWISTQTPQPASTEAKHQDFQSSYYNFMDKDIYDAELIPKAVSWAQAHASAPAFMVLHTLGSHLPLENRYPDTFKQWPLTKVGFGFEQDDNSYSNTILYTDYVLDELMKGLTAQKRPVLLVFVGDHGERQMQGVARAVAPPDARILHVPMLVWANSSWRASHSQQWAALQNKAQLREVTSHLNLAPTLSALSGTGYAGQPASLNLLSPQFKTWTQLPAVGPDLVTAVTVVPPQ